MSNDRDWLQTYLLGTIAYGSLETMEAQKRQLQILERQNDLNIMASKYPAANRVVLEQWLDQYYYWKFGPALYFMQTAFFRVIVPALITGAVLIVMVLIAAQDVEYFLSGPMVDTTIGTTLIAAVISLIGCNILGEIKRRKRIANWPTKPDHTPEIY